jgi:hypothetical protein
MPCHVVLCCLMCVQCSTHEDLNTHLDNFIWIILWIGLDVYLKLNDDLIWG